MLAGHLSTLNRGAINMFASLPMYDWPQLRSSHDALWNNIHDALNERGIQSPKNLMEGGIGLAFWKHPKLILSQTCGLPFRRHLHDKVRLVGTPDFALDGCPPGYYRSYFIVGKNDNRGSLLQFKDAVFALNGRDSQSSYAAARNYISPMGFWFQNLKLTGSHLNAFRAVANGEAEIASIDAVTWRLIERFENNASDIRILEATDPTPGLPYITSLEQDSDAIYDAVIQALAKLDTATATNLGIKSIIKIPKQDYLAVPIP